MPPTCQPCETAVEHDGGGGVGVFIKMNFTGFLTGDMLEVDEFQFSTNDQLLYEVKNKAKLPNTCYALLTFLHLAPSGHTRAHTYTNAHAHTHY